ncbi:aspartate/glutamate racemase family protein [Pullulanibacillus sp. KACC 23026]|uniref:aspartate/glutamate racemase family protein n=1 Tax=Pullulanibacillus sp. KACC 23026 TaxID=3028315 RepID=UPI0023B0AD3E|nr:aspartate/glutamate racemase family protein [Pullulanibacillus sp. KACC 23026]WEG11739.1 aspartate/glutamate racemase family protein [Pullulanibacillus sp. KACC 23026]
MKTVVAVYTGQGLAELVKQAFDEALPDCRLINIIDDSLINDVVKAGEVTSPVKKRLFQYYQNGADMNADLILNTCSSVGEVADLARQFIDKPIVKIDESMAKEAVTQYKKIGVLATLSTTLNPTIRLIEKQAKDIDKEVVLIDGLSEGAYEALVSGRPEEHDKKILETAKQLSDQVDVFVLAQGSMARMEKTLNEATGKPVLSSPKRALLEIKQLLGEL